VVHCGAGCASAATRHAATFVRLNHRCEVVEGVLAEPSAVLQREFLARLRQ
jgi:hypothetical protein